MIDVSEFINSVDIGLDIEFRYKDKGYTILAWHKPIVVGEWDSDNEWFFKDSTDLMENFKVDNLPLKEFLQDIEIVFW